MSHWTVWLLLVDKGLLTAAGTGQGLERRCKFTSRICRVDPPASMKTSHGHLLGDLLLTSAPVRSGLLAQTALATRAQGQHEEHFDHLFDSIMEHARVHFRASMQGHVPPSYLAHLGHRKFASPKTRRPELQWTERNMVYALLGMGRR